MPTLPPNTLVTNRYVPPGTYIGQIIKPAPANLNADVRVPCYIGKGSRLARGLNLGIRRAFVYQEELSFPLAAPFLAVLAHPSDGSQDAPTRLFKQDGTELRRDQYQFVAVGGVFTQVLLKTEVYDPLSTFYLDYQSTDRTVLDPLPVTELRQIEYIGNAEGQNQYKEYVDYAVVTSVSSPVPDAANLHAVSSLSSINAVQIGSSTGTVDFDSASEFAHAYNRAYALVCTAKAGSSPSRTASFTWEAAPQSSGNGASFTVPLNSLEAKPVMTVDETAPTSMVQDLELGIKLTFGFGSGNFEVGDRFEFNGLGPSLIEKDARYDNTNQFLHLGAVHKTAQTGSTGQLTHNQLSQYSGVFNAKYRVKCIAASGVTPNRQATMVWGEAGESFDGGSFILNEAAPASLTQSLPHGLKVDGSFGSTHFVVGDVFNFEVKAPRIYYSGKDSRDITLEVSQAVTNSPTQGSLFGTYLCSTQEGGFGLFETSATLDRTLNGLIQLSGDLKMFARNLFANNQFAGNDKFGFAATDLEQLDWSLNVKMQQEYEASEILNDLLGTVTGNANSFYIVLPHVPLAGSVMVVNAEDGSPISFAEIPGTAFVSFVTNPNVRLLVSFEHKGAEPDPGLVYYFTGLFLRPTEMYDTPQLVLSKDDGRRLLAPANADNHLHIMNEIAWENNVPGVFFIQVRDIDSDSVYTSVDFRRAIQASIVTSRITDRVVLSSFGSIGDQLAINLKANDPFEKKESDDWFGTPIGTPIGDEDTTNSLVFLSRRTLQVYGNSPCHGSRRLVAPTWCKRTIVLDNGLTQQVTLDGSFVAGAVAAKNASFADPSDTLLRKTLAGFDDMQVYSEAENMILGSKQLLFFTSLGNGVFRFEEDMTVDSFAEEFQLISAMNQKQSVTKVVRREMDSSLISLVTPSSQASIQLIRAALASILIGMVSKGVVADYQDESGNVRKFDPNADILVFQDESSKTTFRFVYCYFLKYPIKRLFGLYQVDSNNFGLSV